MQHELFSQQADLLDLPDAELHYLERFVDHPDDWYQHLKHSLAWQQDTIKMYGKAMKIPRMNAWYGDPGMSYSYSGIHLRPLPWTEALFKFKTDVEQYSGYTFNSVLANWYRDQHDSVSWHSDDEPELGKNPVIASLSFGSKRRFSLRHKSRTHKAVHLPLESGSLLLMTGTTQQYWQHQVAKTSDTVTGRINLTFRFIQQPSR